MQLIKRKSFNKNPSDECGVRLKKAYVQANIIFENRLISSFCNVPLLHACMNPRKRHFLMYKSSIELSSTFTLPNIMYIPQLFSHISDITQQQKTFCMDLILKNDEYILKTYGKRYLRMELRIVDYVVYNKREVWMFSLTNESSRVNAVCKCISFVNKFDVDKFYVDELERGVVEKRLNFIQIHNFTKHLERMHEYQANIQTMESSGVEERASKMNISTLIDEASLTECATIGEDQHVHEDSDEDGYVIDEDSE